MRLDFWRKGGSTLRYNLPEELFDPALHVPGLSWGGKPRCITYAQWERMSSWCKEYYKSGGATTTAVESGLLDAFYELWEYEVRQGFSEWRAADDHTRWVGPTGNLREVVEP